MWKSWFVIAVDNTQTHFDWISKCWSINKIARFKYFGTILFLFLTWLSFTAPLHSCVLHFSLESGTLQSEGSHRDKSHGVCYLMKLTSMFTVYKQWNNHLSGVLSCSWVRTLSTEPSCWMLATRKLWKTESTTASSSATWTWSRWMTATSTTATTSRDTSPSPWTSSASGEVQMFGSACDFSSTVPDF